MRSVKYAVIAQFETMSRGIIMFTDLFTYILVSIV